MKFAKFQKLTDLPKEEQDQFMMNDIRPMFFDAKETMESLMKEGNSFELAIEIVYMMIRKIASEQAKLTKDTLLEHFHEYLKENTKVVE